MNKREVNVLIQYIINIIILLKKYASKSCENVIFLVLIFK